MDQEGTTLATEILKEVKASARRWFIAFLVMCGIELATVAGFLWYISLPVDEVTVENEDGNAVYIGDENTMIGGVKQVGQNNEKTQDNEKAPEEVIE